MSALQDISTNMFCLLDLEFVLRDILSSIVPQLSSKLLQLDKINILLLID